MSHEILSLPMVDRKYFNKWRQPVSLYSEGSRRRSFNVGKDVSARAYAMSFFRRTQICIEWGSSLDHSIHPLKSLSCYVFHNYTIMDHYVLPTFMWIPPLDTHTLVLINIHVWEDDYIDRFVLSVYTYQNFLLLCIYFAGS